MQQRTTPNRQSTQNRQPVKKDSRANRSLLLRVIFLLCICGVAMFLPLIWKLYDLQIAQHDYYTQLANDYQTRDVTVTADRGTIYDRNGNILAISATVYNLILSPLDVVAAFDEDDYETEAAYKAAIQERRELIADYLSVNFELDYDRLMTRLEKTNSAYEVVLTNIEDEQAALIRTFISEYSLSPELYLTPDSKRYYPYSSTASHVLGFLGYDAETGTKRVGAYGVEASYETLLAGQSGRVVTAKNAAGTEMLSSYEAYVDAVDGAAPTLTIDANIQSLVEQALESGIEKYYIKNGGFCIVMDPNTGAILAMASSPDYDPNQYDTVIDASLLEELNSIKEKYGADSEEYKSAASNAYNAQWRNKAIADGYEPGSTFKALVVAAALEEGIISLNSTYYCGGHSTIGGWTIHCHKTQGHGSQTLTEALENSCNVALMDIGMELGAERFWQYLEDYGLMDKTGIDLGGEGVSLFTSKDIFTSEIGLSSLAVYSFGQTFKVTPLRMITSFASVINGGHLLTPYVVQSATDESGSTVYYHETEEVRQVLSETTSATLREMLESVVANGTGKNAYKAGYRIGGKTGTSEKRDEEGDDVIVSFMGFAPADDPQVLVLLAFDSPERSSAGSKYTPGGTYISGGNIAAPACGELIADILNYLGVEKEYTSAEEYSKADVSVPTLTGKTLTEAQAALTQVGLELRTVGDGDTVTGQIPAAGTSIPGGSQVVLYLGTEVPTDTVTVPDLTGKSPAAVENALKELGLYVRATGVATFTSSTSAAGQSIAPDTQVARGTVIDVQFVEDSISDYGG